MTTKSSTQTTGSIMITGSFAVLGSQLPSIVASEQYNGRQARPRTFNGAYVPAIGSEISTAYGDATVVGYEGTSLRVAVTDFVSDSAEKVVASLAKSRNETLWTMLNDWHSKHKELGMSDAKFDELYFDKVQFFESNEILMQAPNQPVQADTLYMVDTIGVYVDKEKERKALEVAEARKLRKALKRAYAELEELDCPEDVASDIAIEFGTDLEDVEDDTVGNWVDL